MKIAFYKQIVPISEGLRKLETLEVQYGNSQLM